MKIVNVILSGGVGSRLWPLSRMSKPKQYLNLFGDKSLFDLTVQRNSKYCDKVVVVANKSNLELSKSTLQKSNMDSTFITEDTPRNTAAAIAFAAFSLDQGDIMLVTPSDHIINADANYDAAIKNAIDFAEAGNLSTFGILATKPETGYGYIEYEGSNVISFHEKPNENLAKEFIEKGSFLWNSGIFCFKVSTFLSELLKFEPQIYNTAKSAWDNAVDGILDGKLSLEIPSKSVDYAIFEKSDRIKVVKSDFIWSDLGSFEALYDYLMLTGYPIDKNGNMVLGTKNPAFFLGLYNTILVQTEDATLILNKEKSQDVKNVYEKVKSVFPKLL